MAGSASTVKADGALQYQDFFLGNPDRLVIDFKDVTSRAPASGRSTSTRDPVRKVRLAQFSAASPRVARLVLDLSARAPYRIVDGADGVKIVFGEGETSARRPRWPRCSRKPTPRREPSCRRTPPCRCRSCPRPAPAPMPVLPDPQAAPPTRRAAGGVPAA